MILRNFLFLDTATMADYLATLEGSIIEGPIDHKESGRKEKGIKGGIDYIAKASGGYASETSAETRQTRVINNAANFQRLYELLEKDHLQYLDAFDEGIWSQLRRGELLEVQARIRIPEFLLMIESAESLAPMVDVMKALGQEPIDSETETAFRGISELVKLFENKPVPLVFEAASTPGFEFVAELSRQFLLSALSDLQGEAVVLGKVLRVLPEGKEHEVFSLIPSALAKLDKAKYEEAQRDLREKNVTEVVKGPAIIMAPLAVYR